MIAESDDAYNADDDGEGTEYIGASDGNAGEKVGAVKGRDVSAEIDASFACLGAFQGSNWA